MARTRLDHDHLELLDAFAKSGSLVRAAAMLGLTQPALSYRVKEAERRLGVALFVRRQGRPVGLTAAAERLLPTAALVVDALARAEEDVRRISLGFHYVVRLAVTSRACFDWLPSFLAAFRLEHPEIDVDLAIVPNLPVAAALAAHEIDVAVTAEPLAAVHATVHALFDETAVVLMAPDHDLSAAETVLPEHFARRGYVTDEVPLDSDPWFRAVLVPAGITPQRMVPSGSPEATAALVASSAALSIVGTRRGHRFAATGKVVCRALGTRDVGLSWRSVLRAGESDATPATFVADQMSYWCQARLAELTPSLD